MLNMNYQRKTWVNIFIILKRGQSDMKSKHHKGKA